MKVRVYFCKEAYAELLFKDRKVSMQNLDSLYDLVWESEFKNILNVGRVWLKFKEEEKPFGIPLRGKRNHSKISPGDIIQIGVDYYLVNSIGAKRLKFVSSMSAD